MKSSVDHTDREKLRNDQEFLPSDAPAEKIKDWSKEGQEKWISHNEGKKTPERENLRKT